VSGRLRCFVLALALAAAPGADAQTYPDRPLRLLVGFAAGGGADIVARHFAAKMGELLGQQVVVDNRPGAGATIAAEIAARAPADGYTLFQCGIASFAIAPALYRKLRYDQLRDFVPVTFIGAAPNVLVVHPSLPVNTLGEFIAYLKANPGKVHYGSSGVGSTLHLSMELFKSMTHVDIVHVPYKGGALALNDLLGGHVQAMCDNIQGQLAAIRGGRVRPLAVTWSRRVAQLPDVPTFAESGLPGFEIGPWYGVCAPAGVPKAIVARLDAVAAQALAASDLRQRLAEQGIEPRPMSPAEFAGFIRSESVRWAKAVKDAGVPAQ